MTEFSSFNIIDEDMLTIEDKQEENEVEAEEKNEIIAPLPIMIPNQLPNVV
jgi:hypothetical protein